MKTENAAERLRHIATLMRSYILRATTRAGSGHPTSSLSATELVAALLFGGTFRFDVANPAAPNNDRLIFSKGHASPLLYAAWAAAGAIDEAQIMTYRQFGSPLEGHPAVRFPYTEAATGSLGQGLSIGVGMAINAKYLDGLPYRTYVLLGDSEMAEGSQWEAMETAAYRKLHNLIGIIDVNRLGQRGETMYGWDVDVYARRADAFGWRPIVIDGHSYREILAAYEQAVTETQRPVMIVARTVKGKGVSFLEDKDGWHGKALTTAQLATALDELGPIDTSVRGEIPAPEPIAPRARPAPAPSAERTSYPRDEPVATRAAFGRALVRIYPQFPAIVCLDGEVSNSTRTDAFARAHPDRFFEMYIAEQNMVGTALGLARRGAIPFVSTFAAFFTRAFDQIRMAQYSGAAIKYVGSHAGVSIGEDGPSQMGLEDIAMFRAVQGVAVLHPCDAVSTDALVEALAAHPGSGYLRTLREPTAIIYGEDERFDIGGSKVLRQSPRDLVTVVAAGVTVHEALTAWERLRAEDLPVQVIDAYSIKPIDEVTLRLAAEKTQAVVTVEDHHPEGGLGEAVAAALAGTGTPVRSLAVRRQPQSGKPEQLLEFEDISWEAIVRTVREVVRVRV